MGEARTFYPNTIPAPIRKLWIAYDLLVKLGEPYIGGSVIGGSRNSHAESGRHPDPKGAPFRSRLVRADRQIEALAAGLRKLAIAEPEPDDANRGRGWTCPCSSHYQPQRNRFCGACGRPRESREAVGVGGQR